ncbi:MerR family transcriptional regulator [Rhodoblastus sp. 17X3]|uniref:MerR family transcriptional regulator n=1 Tax=Rhodoblastus sp. 17X3 TaxID=3047026 RepID=UPI0024B63E6B|nr:MerR family transcriptional regulator [Rhodoblastus sp. 17X3]MDI9849389.1 MerR family transcriptional regulator [Rhodoblastus sp. 17X3]
MDKTQDAFRTIGEVAEALDLPQHVLRFWETKFSQIRPVKRVGGRRYYRPEDIQLVGAIRVLLYSEGYTIRGVQRILKEQGARAVVAASRAKGAAPADAERALAKFDPTQAGPGAEFLTELDMDRASEPDESVRASGDGSPGATRLSAQDRHRMEAILAELAEGARILEEARGR